MTTESTAANHREPQVAIVPLDQVALEDMGLAAAHIDDWLRAISDDMITLERLQHFAENYPLVRLKVDKALLSGLTPIICLGETARKKMKAGRMKCSLSRCSLLLPGLPMIVSPK